MPMRKEDTLYEIYEEKRCSNEMLVELGLGGNLLIDNLFSIINYDEKHRNVLGYGKRDKWLDNGPENPTSGKIVGPKVHTSCNLYLIQLSMND